MHPLICIECRRTFEKLEDALKHVFEVTTVIYNDASPGRPKKIKTVKIAIQLRRHQVFWRYSLGFGRELVA